MSADANSYAEALQFIWDRSDLAHGFISNPSSGQFDPALGLVRTRALLDAMGAPDRTLPLVHIAGSKGKGSTSAYTASIGTAAGYRTGLLTSPHLHSFRERLVIDGEPIDEADFAQLMSESSAIVEALERDRPELGRVTAFELITAMALWHFARSDCQLAVVEVGLGGTYDATNVIEPQVSIITRLDLEHTQVLGNTIEEIADNKSGIIKSGVPVISANQDAAALQVIERRAHEKHSPLQIGERDFTWTGSWQDFTFANDSGTLTGLATTLQGNHQMENASLAISAWECLASQGWQVSSEDIRAGLKLANLPGRFERVVDGGQLFILDAAHTEVAAAALVQEIQAITTRPVVIILGMLREKRARAFVQALEPVMERLVATEPNSARALPVDDLTFISLSAGVQVVPSKNLDNALQIARDLTDPGLPILITGSFALVAEARELFGLAIADQVPAGSTRH